MIRIFGFVFIISASSMYGFYFSSRIEERYRQLKLVIKMLGEIKIYLEFAVMTKSEIFLKIFSDNQYDFFKEENLNSSMLSKKEINYLYEFYNQLGTTDLQGQLYALEMYKNSFTEWSEELKAVKENKCRLIRTSGILIGIFLCLMLI